jgi:heme exporter protein A
MLCANQITCLRGEQLLFHSLSFSLPKATLLCIQGDNGVGKSSLLRLLCGFYEPSQGEILWQQQSIFSSVSQYKEQVHYIGHAAGIRMKLTVKENLLLAQHLFSQPLALRLEEVLTKLALQREINQKACDLSLGQQRKIALAKLLLFQKPIWILDEPLTALDANTQALFLALLREHVENGGIGIISSHQAIPVITKNIQQLNLNQLKSLDPSFRWDDGTRQDRMSIITREVV